MELIHALEDLGQAPAAPGRGQKKRLGPAVCGIPTRGLDGEMDHLDRW